MMHATPEAHQLLHRGAVALAAASAAGIRVDTAYLDHTIAEVATKISGIEDRLKSMEEYRLQKRRYGLETNLTSRDQLAHVLFNEQGHTPLKGTRTGKHAMDDEVLSKIGTSYCKGFLRLEKLNKLHGTYLLGVKRHVDGELLHPSFTLHNVQSYRGASRDPNFQNIPIRDPSIAHYIRKAFIPRDGHALVEIDLKANEVRVACCYTDDPTLIYDTLEGDMHRDMAAECFCLEQAEVPKALRQVAKGAFVFAEFYGDWYPKVARNLWEQTAGMELSDGYELHSYLADHHGIEELGACDPKGKQRPLPRTFEKHIQEVEHRFWKERYKVYDQWKRDWYEAYLRQGWFQMKTGFTVRWGKGGGVMGRNDCVNYPIQGSAFHCLLWALIKLYSWLKKHRMRSVIVGQIHDSIILDCHLRELDDVVAKASALLVEDIREDYDWLIIPLGVEAEVAYGNWWGKKEYKIG